MFLGCWKRRVRSMALSCLFIILNWIGIIQTSIQEVGPEEKQGDQKLEIGMPTWTIRMRKSESLQRTMISLDSGLMGGGTRHPIKRIGIVRWITELVGMTGGSVKPTR